jgi:hypothetical protein
MRSAAMVAALVGGMMVQPIQAISQRAPDAQALPAPQPDKPKVAEEDRSKLADAAIIALIITASITAYKASGKPCACPSDTMKNGASCGNRSAWAKPGGAKPLCFLTDITADMIKGYQATKAIPGMW